MAHIKKSKKEKTNTERSHRFSEKFVIPLGRIRDFYCVVSTLNSELGHGNWTTVGRPVRKLRRCDRYNRVVFSADRKLDIVFRVPFGSESIASRLLLELSR